MKQIIEFLGIGGLGMGFVVVLVLFMTAYSHPDKKVLVEIDHYGEADLEFALFLILIPCVIYVFMRALERI